MTALSIGNTLNVLFFHKTAETEMKRAFTDSRVNKETLFVTELHRTGHFHRAEPLKCDTCKHMKSCLILSRFFREVELMC